MRILGEDAPVGSSEVLAKAKAELAPFTCKHEPKLQVLCRCEKCVEESIRKLATWFNRRRRLNATAPRSKDVVKNLGRVALAASELAEALSSLDDYSRRILRAPTKYLDHDEDPGVSLFKESGGVDLPTPETQESAASDGTTVQRLLALGKYVSHRLYYFEQSRGPESLVDKGGNTNLFKERHGPPAWMLVRVAWSIFENCKSGEATGTDGGRFHRFVNHTYEFATGETEENSTLLNLTKRFARRLRHHDQLLQKLGMQEGELEDLKFEPPSAENEARTLQLEKEIPALREEVVDAFIKLGSKQ
jgi:hypothetical protein